MVRFDYRGHVFNLLDTPGHADFSEDTSRALYAADAAVMLLDADRALPLITFVNKCDRLAPSPLALLEQLASETGLAPVPLTWPASDGGAFHGIVDLRRGELVETERTRQKILSRQSLTSANPASIRRSISSSSSS